MQKNDLEICLSHFFFVLLRAFLEKVWRMLQP